MSRIAFNLATPQAAKHESLPHAAMMLGAMRGLGMAPGPLMVARLVIEPQTGGWIFHRLDEHGGFVGDSWHATREGCAQAGEARVRDRHRGEFVMAKQPNSFFGWLGRQIGHVKGAIKKDAAQPKVLYRKTTVQEAPVADRPDEKLRRTVTDEVVREEKRLDGH